MGWGWVFLQRIPDGFLDRFELGQNLIVPKTQYRESRALQRASPTRVIQHVGGGRMLTAIHFDNEAGFQTNEVENIAFESVLAPKLVPIHLPHSQSPPKLSLSFGRPRPQFSLQLAPQNLCVGLTLHFA